MQTSALIEEAAHLRHGDRIPATALGGRASRRPLHALVRRLGARRHPSPPLVRRPVAP